MGYNMFIRVYLYRNTIKINARDRKECIIEYCDDNKIYNRQHVFKGIKTWQQLGHFDCSPLTTSLTLSVFHSS